MTPPKDVQELAQQYVDKVLETQRRSGHEARLSQEAYAEAVSRAAEGFAALTDRDERQEDRIPA